MLTDPSNALQVAIVTALKADQGVAAIVGDRVFDKVGRAPDGSPNVAFPYVSIGDGQVIPELAECTDSADVYVTLHAWSEKPGFPEVNALASAIAAALHDQPLTIAGGAVLSLLLQQKQSLRDPDGLRSHAVLTFHIITDANS